MLFMNDKPSPAFIHVWYTNTEFSSVAAFHPICALSGMWHTLSHTSIPQGRFGTPNVHLETKWFLVPLGSWFLAHTLLLHCAALSARSQCQGWGCNDRTVEDLDCREGTFQVLPDTVWSKKKKKADFFLIGSLNLALLYSFSSQCYQHRAVQLPSTGARAQLTQKVRNPAVPWTCCLRACQVMEQTAHENQHHSSNLVHISFPVTLIAGTQGTGCWDSWQGVPYGTKG